MDEIAKIVDQMDPAVAVTEIAIVLRKLLPILGEEARARFVADLLGEPGYDKVASMVHL